MLSEADTLSANGYGRKLVLMSVDLDAHLDGTTTVSTDDPRHFCLLEDGVRPVSGQDCDWASN